MRSPGHIIQKECISFHKCLILILENFLAFLRVKKRDYPLRIINLCTTGTGVKYSAVLWKRVESVFAWYNVSMLHLSGLYEPEVILNSC